MFHNDFDHLVSVLPLSLVNGIVLPYTTSALLFVYCYARANLYTKGYFEKEGSSSNKRMVGSVAVNLVNVATMGISTVLAIRMIRGKLDVQKALSLIPKK